MLNGPLHSDTTSHSLFSWVFMFTANFSRFPLVVNFPRVTSNSMIDFYIIGCFVRSVLLRSFGYGIVVIDIWFISVVFTHICVWFYPLGQILCDLHIIRWTDLKYVKYKCIIYEAYAYFFLYILFMGMGDCSITLVLNLYMVILVTIWYHRKIGSKKDTSQCTKWSIK